MLRVFRLLWALHRLIRDSVSEKCATLGVWSLVRSCWRLCFDSRICFAFFLRFLQPYDPQKLCYKVPVTQTCIIGTHLEVRFWIWSCFLYKKRKNLTLVSDLACALIGLASVFSPKVFPHFSGDYFTTMRVYEELRNSRNTSRRFTAVCLGILAFFFGKTCLRFAGRSL